MTQQWALLLLTTTHHTLSTTTNVHHSTPHRSVSHDTTARYRQREAINHFRVAFDGLAVPLAVTVTAGSATATAALCSHPPRLSVVELLRCCVVAVAALSCPVWSFCPAPLCFPRSLTAFTGRQPPFQPLPPAAGRRPLLRGPACNPSVSPLQPRPRHQPLSPHTLCQPQLTRSRQPPQRVQWSLMCCRLLPRKSILTQWRALFPLLLLLLPPPPSCLRPRRPRCLRLRRY